MRLTIVSALFLICHIAAGQSTSRPGEPTLQETAQSVQSYLVGTSHRQQHSEFYFDTNSSPPRETGRALVTMDQTISSVSIDACTLSIVIQSKVDDVPASTLEFDVPLKKMKSFTWTDLEIPTRSTPTRRVTEIPNPIGMIVVQTTEPAISSKFFMLSNKTTGDELIDRFNILVDEKQMAPKLLKALNRAATLCSATSLLESF